MNADNIPTRALDLLGAGTIIATIIGYLPALAALAALVWYCVQILESHTVQSWWQNRQMVKKAKRIVHLRAKEKIISAELEALETIRQAKVDARDKVEIARLEAAKLQLKQKTDVEERLPPNGDPKD